jgi:hypothetical protein
MSGGFASIFIRRRPLMHNQFQLAAGAANSTHQSSSQVQSVAVIELES